ncbi:hypothetical protein FHR32_002088 [Streptosporangium album]|uniref:Uncharacterized protein n=1 Tax=Streptosporangium album TaxID=47479 RepID=A0A7W7W8C4_9ACTN|nr:hypothetical protein [Streptosporangium album]MBB4937783.1 hypothetical protein [Streptosporangium album]
MSPRTSAALAGLALAVLAAGCADPAADRVSPVSATQPPASPPLPSLTVVPPPSPMVSSGPATPGLGVMR